MSPSDKNKAATNSQNGKGESQECSKPHTMNSSSELASSSTSDVTLPGHGTIANIPLVTASLPTLKCSINNQMKTFDPGENGGIQRLTSNHCGNSVFPAESSSSISSGIGISSSSIMKNSNKNYKAGSKINKLADMLAKRSQNVVEVTQNNASDIIMDMTGVTKLEDSVILNNVSNIMNFEQSLNSPIVCFEKTAKNKDLDLYRKSRRKSVPNQSCNFHHLQLESTTSKSCSDFSKLFPLEENGKLEFNALGESLIKLQTDESTKKKAIRKNLKNVQLSLILPEKKRRSSTRNENIVSSKLIEKILDVSSPGEPIEEANKNIDSPKEIVTSSVQSPIRSVSSTKIKREGKVKQRKSKRLVESSTQTADIEFISVIKPKAEVEEEDKRTREETSKPTITYECLYCTQTFALGSQCKAHEKTHSHKTNKQIIKCQYCFKKLSSLNELKSHCVKKHSNKYAYCMKCDERFTTKEDLYSHNNKMHFGKDGEGLGQSMSIVEEAPPEDVTPENKKEETEEKRISKENGVKSDLKIDVTCDSSKKSSMSPRTVQKFSPKETKTEEQLLEMEMLFYSHLSGNIQENLTNHLDGKIDKSGNPVRTDQISEPADSTQARTKSSGLLSVAPPATGVPDVQVSRAPSPYQTRSKTPNPLPPTAKKFKKLPNWQQKFWEKYNFPTNYRYEHRFWDKNYLNTEKSAFYLKDLSCLDIKTQLTMRENIKKLDNIKLIEENSKSGDKLKFPDYLSLIPKLNGGNNQETGADSQKVNSENSKGRKQVRKEKDETKNSFKSPGSELPVMKTRRKLSSDNSVVRKAAERTNGDGLKMVTRKSCIDLTKEDKEEEVGGRKRKGSLDMSNSQRMTLRRQTSLDNLHGNGKSKAEKNDEILEYNLNNIEADSSPHLLKGSAEISGEWVRPRSYLCGTCCAKFTNLWELEDHKWVSHPNVWCTHYEFEDEKIDKLFRKSEDDGKEADSADSSDVSKLKLTDLYKRYLLPHGSLKTAKLVPNTNFPEKCTKCKKNCMSSSEMHKHMLDCGGDTTWFLTMYSSPMTIKRKWRPFGSRRRKQIGRRDLKRNIPSTPTLRSYHYQHRIRTKPGDVESIQKMLANLPEKRARRAINFDEIKTRSQATIHSNRLLRKRFKSSFANNFLKLKSLKQKRQLKSGKREGSSKSTTDTSSETTPIGSPKRRNKLKENLQFLKEENSREGSSESSGDTDTAKSGKKGDHKKKEVASSPPNQKNGSKRKVKNEDQEVKMEKPVTRSNALLKPIDKPKGKTLVVKEEIIDSVGVTEDVPKDQKPKSKKKSKKKKVKKEKLLPVKQEIEETVTRAPELISPAEDGKDKETPAKSGKKVKNLKKEETMESSIRKSYRLSSIQSHTMLRLKQTNKGKTELLKRMKKKLKKSKRVLELKEARKVKEGSRRSLRIRSLQVLDSSSELANGHFANVEVKIEDINSKLKKPIENLENTLTRKSLRTNTKPIIKSNEDKNETKDLIPEESVMLRRSSRSLRNSISLEEKPEIPTNNDVPVENPRKTLVLRRNSKIICEVSNPIAPDVEEAITPKRSPRNQNNKGYKTGDEKPDPLSLNEQISLLTRSRVQVTRLSRESAKSDSNKYGDLSEMPILAKVEPIRGKTTGKNEKEIPILMPVEKEPNVEEEVKEEKPTRGKDVVSFQVVKKRRKDSKELAPLKIVKTVEKNTSGVEENGLNGCFRVEESDGSSLEDSGYMKRRRCVPVAPVAPVFEKTTAGDKRWKNPNDKKYFLGICPGEIDKGRKETLDESGSDSEPLISLVMNQSQKKSENDLTNPVPILKEEEIQVGKEEVEPAVTLVKETKKLKKNKKRKGKVKKLTKTFSSPNASLEPAQVTENSNIPNNEVQPEQSKETKIPDLNKETGKSKKKKKVAKKKEKRICMTVTLKEPTLKILDKSSSLPAENKWTLKVSEPKMEIEAKSEPLPDWDVKEVSPETIKESILPERRSRRISKETKSTSEFIIDDPLILVDELWSDLDSDSDSSRKKTKKGKKKSGKKKTSEDKRISDVNLEELLRNFGENKEAVAKASGPSDSVAPLTVRVVKKRVRSFSDVRKLLENRKERKSYRRLSLKLFRFNKNAGNFGNRGERLSTAKKALREKREENQVRCNPLPDLPFLASEIKENPVQVIQCRAKGSRKGHKKIDAKPCSDNIHLKISLPLESINNMAVFNNNHLTELIVEDQQQQPQPPPPPPPPEIVAPYGDFKDEKEVPSQPEEPVKENHVAPDEVSVATEINEFKNKSKRSEVIDKIFYCEICKTYYYSSSQLKIHKLSNRHKLKESELLEQQQVLGVVNVSEASELTKDVESIPLVENVLEEPSVVESNEAERLSDDTLEMPTLEGPFIESPIVRTGTETIEPAPQPPVVNNFGFSQESLKDIQRAIGCTDEEMLILTLLGENTIEIENDILDLDTCRPVPSKIGSSPPEKTDSSQKENEKANGVLKVDLKQRMTSALACLVNKAVFNLLQKYETAAKSAVHPEALSLLGKLSSLSRRKNIFQLNELFKKQSDGETSIGSLTKDWEKKEPPVSYKYQCTICGSRFEKASTRECHISRSHKGKAKKVKDESQVVQTFGEDDWNDSWSYDINDEHLGSSTASQFWCSDCGINFLSPQKVHEHQKLEHQAGLKETEHGKDQSPLQSSTIGSSDEIIEGKKPRRRPKLFSSEELDQQRIIANNELRKLDRKFSNKNKGNKIKWGMDALKFTVAKENKMVVVEGDKEASLEETEKSQIDLVPKLNLSRTSSIPEFKVIQKNSLKNRFQKIIDNKLKRKSSRLSQPETDEMETEVMLVPVVVKKKNKKQKTKEYPLKKGDGEKVLDVYDFNESESEGEPVVFSHVKKPTQLPTKLKLVKVKESPSKNKADSTTKDLAPDDYDSEDSLPLSIVKKSKPGDEEEEKEEKGSDDGVEKSDGILEQVEYLIEQLENETGSSGEKRDVSKDDKKDETDSKKSKSFLKDEGSKEDSVDSVQESIHVSLSNSFLELENLPLKNQERIGGYRNEDSCNLPTEDEKVEISEQDGTLAEVESSQSTFDEEDSIPLVLMSKKADDSKEKKCEDSTDLSTSASEDTQLFREDKGGSVGVKSPIHSQPIAEESLPPVFSSSSENDGGLSEKSDKAFESLNGNVIYCRNDSMSDYGSDLSNESNQFNFDKADGEDGFIKEVTEKEDVVIVCSKGDEEGPKEGKGTNRLKRKESLEGLRRKKKRFPLLSATIEENSFRKSESPKLNKELIVRKIWSRRRLPEESTDNDEDSVGAMDSKNSIESIQNEESQAEIEKEIIVKKIWSRKKVDHEEDVAEKPEEKPEDIKINQTEISDEVVIKCGPKSKPSPKRRKSRTSTNESSKETIMRKIWSGKCTFQTKAALKTYDSDVILNCKENNVSEGQRKAKRRGRPVGFSSKRSKVDAEESDEDDLDSLLEEIEREQLEKAIRLEFLQLRRSEKANAELKEGSNPTVGLFAETGLRHKREISERKRRKVRRNIKHPRRSLLKRKKFAKKPMQRLLRSEEKPFSDNASCVKSDTVTEQSENSLDKSNESFDVESKIKNRKHKKHRHKHHHHKHKHKKSKHHKCVVSKHKSKHKFEAEGEAGGGERLENRSDSFTILEKICQEIPNQIESEMESKSRTSRRRSSSDFKNSSPDLTSFSFEDKTKDCEGVGYEGGEKTRQAGNGNVYEFGEDG